LDLADCCHGNQNLGVDILIGADHFYLLGTEKVNHDLIGLIAVHARLGFVWSFYREEYIS